MPKPKTPLHQAINNSDETSDDTHLSPELRINQQIVILTELLDIMSNHAATLYCPPKNTNLRNIVCALTGITCLATFIILVVQYGLTITYGPKEDEAALPRSKPNSVQQDLMIFVCNYTKHNQTYEVDDCQYNPVSGFIALAVVGCATVLAVISCMLWKCPQQQPRLSDLPNDVKQLDNKLIRYLGSEIKKVEAIPLDQQTEHDKTFIQEAKRFVSACTIYDRKSTIASLQDIISKEKNDFESDSSSKNKQHYYGKLSHFKPADYRTFEHFPLDDAEKGQYFPLTKMIS